MYKIYKYNRYTLRLSDEMNDYIKKLSDLRGTMPPDVIKSIIGEHRERSIHGRRD